MTSNSRDKTVWDLVRLLVYCLAWSLESQLLRLEDKGWKGLERMIVQPILDLHLPGQELGLDVSHIHLRHIWPLPRNLKDLLSGYEQILVPEMNTGQLVKLLRAEYLLPAEGLNKISGQPFKVAELDAAIRARLSGRCRADRDEACENCYSPHSSTLCPFSIEARASAVESGVELVLAPTNGEALRWVLPRHARPPWRLPQHAPL